MTPSLQQVENLINQAMNSFEPGELFGSLPWEYRHFVGQLLADALPGLVDVVNVVVEDPWRKRLAVKLPIETPCIYMQGHAFDGERFVPLEPLTDDIRRKLYGENWQAFDVKTPSIKRSGMFAIEIKETRRLKQIIQEGVAKIHADQLDTQTREVAHAIAKPRF